MTLQYQLSSGTWVDCGDRTDEFMALCLKFNGWGVIKGGKHDGENGIVPFFAAERPATLDEITAALERGDKLRNDSADWYSVCRAKPEPKQEAKPTITAAPKLSGQLWEPCPNCGREPVYLSNGGYCEKCGR